MLRACVRCMHVPAQGHIAQLHARACLAALQYPNCCMHVHLPAWHLACGADVVLALSEWYEFFNGLLKRCWNCSCSPPDLALQLCEKRCDNSQDIAFWVTTHDGLQVDRLQLL